MSNIKFNFSQEKFLVSGGTSGIGLEVVEMLLKYGADVVVASRGKTKNIEFDRLKNKITFYEVDLSSNNSILSFLEKIENEKFNGFLNCASIIHAGDAETIEIEDWNDVIQINLTGAFLLTKHIAPLIVDRGSIVQVSSISSKRIGASIAYSVSKAGLDVLTKGFAKVLAKRDIRVNSVNPGIVETGFQLHNNIFDNSGYKKMLKDLSVNYPLGLGNPNDIAPLICFLLSDASRWITGENFFIDGGNGVK